MIEGKAVPVPPRKTKTSRPKLQRKCLKEDPFKGDPAEAIPSRRGSSTSRRQSTRRPSSELLETAPQCDPAEAIPSRRVSTVSRRPSSRLMSVETAPQYKYTSMEIIHTLYNWKYGYPCRPTECKDHVNGEGLARFTTVKYNMPNSNNLVKECSQEQRRCFRAMSM
uniref:Uncharacterized protein n=1 Tax=Sphaerodactylus townsendi TaxID=933632 RepID=A0ACB8FU71_9SAUR